MARGMHKGPRNTRTDKWKSEKDAKKTTLQTRQSAWESVGGSKTKMHKPGSNKK